MLQKKKKKCSMQTAIILGSEKLSDQIRQTITSVAHLPEKVK
jgi:hypothetical protein